MPGDTNRWPVLDLTSSATWSKKNYTRKSTAEITGYTYRERQHSKLQEKNKNKEELRIKGEKEW